MQTTNYLQVGVIVGAIVLVTIAIMILTGFLPGLRESFTSGGTVIMWGFDSEDSFSDVFHSFGQAYRGSIVKYTKKNPVNFEDELLNAVARGESPNLIVFPSDFFKKHKDILASAPAITMTEREISQQFIDSAQTFLGPKNEVMGIPIYAETLQLYFNKDIFTENFVTLPPVTWDEVLNLSGKMTKKDDSGNILISGAALGRASNIKNATTILTALLLQSGDPIFNQAGEIVFGDLPDGFKNTQLRPAESALLFFSDFANPAKVAQSWSAALPDSRDMFAAGKLAMYFGGNRDFDIIKTQNPHLNFAVAPLPQLSKNVVPITSGVLYALAVPKASKNQNLSWALAKYLTSKDISTAYAKTKNDVSPRRDVLPAYSGDSVKSVFAGSILALNLWPNPDPDRSENILRALIEDVALGKGTIRESIDRAKAKFNQKI
ncbi:MAG: extracellular solute-binding protein [bacterium]|nr:extracellular solute-binding protein [bacterium]